MKVVDSSGWIEYFADGPLAPAFETHLRALDQVLTPTIVVHEVFRWMKKFRGEELALAVAAAMRQTRSAPLDEPLALLAADTALQHGLALADSIVYATARQAGARLVTSDADFADLAEVEYVPPKHK